MSLGKYLYQLQAAQKAFEALSRMRPGKQYKLILQVFLRMLIFSLLIFSVFCAEKSLYLVKIIKLFSIKLCISYLSLLK